MGEGEVLDEEMVEEAEGKVKRALMSLEECKGDGDEDSGYDS